MLPTALTAAVFDRSDGIPLHVEEFLAILTRTGTSIDEAAGVPETPADAVLGRAQHLSPAARGLASAASVIG